MDVTTVKKLKAVTKPKPIKLKAVTKLTIMINKFTMIRNVIF